MESAICIVAVLVIYGLLLSPNRFFEQLVARMSPSVRACITALMEQTAFLPDCSVFIRAAADADCGCVKCSNHGIQSLSVLCAKSALLIIRLHRVKEPGHLLFCAATFNGCQRRGGSIWEYGTNFMMRINVNRIKTS